MNLIILVVIIIPYISFWKKIIKESKSMYDSKNPTINITSPTLNSSLILLNSIFLLIVLFGCLLILGRFIYPIIYKN